MTNGDVGQAVFLLQVLKQIDDLRLGRHIERGYRLVADGDELRRHAKRTRDPDPLTLAARELMRIVAHVIGVQADRFE
jgi:hypothetical protein